MNTSESWIRIYCRLHRQTKAMGNSLRDIARPHKLSINEALLLLVCAEACPEQSDSFQGHAQRDLARLTTMSPAAVSGHLDTLRQRGWVEGNRDGIDRRRQTWTATQAGQKLSETINAQIQESTGTETDTSAETTSIRPPYSEAA